MIISANQPYFAPFPGFFYKMCLCDVMVLLDDVQFPRGTTWITRNRFKNDQGTLWMTIPVKKKGLGLQNIKDVAIFHDGKWPRKHLLSLDNAYRNAPYFKDHFDFFADLFSKKHDKLMDFNLETIKYLAHALNIGTKVVLLSQLGIESHGNRLLVDICRTLDASRYLAQRPAQKFIDPNLFRHSNIEIQLFKYPQPIYPQLWGDFVSNLSTFDLLFTCGPKARDILGGTQQ